MKNKCDCYHTQQKTRYTYNQFTGSPIPHDIEVGVCWGTKETDECNCGGDETKCDFYPEVRKKAKQELKKSEVKIGEDSLIVAYDCSLSDAPVLCVGKIEIDNLKILNTLYGDKALYTYALLTDGAEIKENKIIRCRDCNVPHNKWTGCPKLNGLVTPPDFYCAFGELKVKDE